MSLRILRHGRVDSTSERAFAALAAGSACHGDVHLGTAQSAGRGRLGRTWTSPEGQGLYLSLVLLPDPPAPPPAALTMGAGLAVWEAVRALGLAAAQLKWPNDVLVHDAKLAGILVEARGLDPAAPHAVVGIGLNVRQERFPPELEAERAVTSLRLEGLDVGLEQTLAALLGPLEARMTAALQAPEQVAQAYADALGLLGRRVRLAQAAGERRGILRELSLRGLVLEDGAERHHACLEHVTGLRAGD